MNADTTYEIWVQTADGKWGQVVDTKSNIDLWPTRSAALAIAGKMAQDVRVVQMVGIKRTLSFTLKGQASLEANPHDDRKRVDGVPARPDGPLQGKIPDDGQDPRPGTG